VACGPSCGQVLSGIPYTRKEGSYFIKSADCIPGIMRDSLPL
jgi:hypothetical protein